MRTYYIYEVNRTRAFSIGEIGIYQRIFEGEQPLHYNDRYNDEDRRLLGTFQAHHYNHEDGTLQITGDGPIHELQGLYSAPYSVSVEEAAIFLSLSEQRIRALLVEYSNEKKIRGRKTSGVWLIQGTELIRFATIERPDHRPMKEG